MTERIRQEMRAPRRHRFTVRTRLALTYAALLSGAGLIMLAIIFVFMGLLPNYEFAAPTSSALPSAVEPQSIEDPGVEAPQRDAPGAQSSSVPAQLTPALVVNSRQDVLNLLLVVSGLVMAVLAGGGILAGWLVAGRMLRPLQEVGAAARRAAAGELDHRIRLLGPPDEITELSDTFDEMLESLERAFGSQRRFAANASHELRTPLATTRTMLDVALATAPEAQRPLLDRLRAANERSIDTVEALLDLSEIDAAAPRHDTIDFARIVSDALAETAPESDVAGVAVESRILPATVRGNGSLLRQLVLNLLQNAIRHNTPGGYMRVSVVGGADGRITLRVENDGEMISEELVSTLTDPFVRGAGRVSRSGAAGRGLGLSIVSAIADQHEAALDLIPRDGGGLDARVRFPSGHGAPVKPARQGRSPGGVRHEQHT